MFSDGVSNTESTSDAGNTGGGGGGGGLVVGSAGVVIGAAGVPVGAAVEEGVSRPAQGCQARTAATPPSRTAAVMAVGINHFCRDALAVG
jgi:hypothetical protein